MGGCASRPKDLDVNEPTPVEAPVVEKVESETVAQENNGGEEKTEEPLVDLSEPKEEEVKESSESKPAEEPVVAAETKAEEKVQEEVKDEAVPVAVPAPAPVEAEVVVAAASEPEKVAETVVQTPEPVKEEAKPVEGQVIVDKSDAPLVTM